MANDRLYLRCNKCNKWFFLAKCWGGGRVDIWRDQDVLEDWFGEHYLSCGLDFDILNEEKHCEAYTDSRKV